MGLTNAEISYGLVELLRRCLQGDDPDACRAWYRFVFIVTTIGFGGKYKVPIPLGDPPIDVVLPPNLVLNKAEVEQQLKAAHEVRELIPEASEVIDEEIAALERQLAGLV
jgi:hypothetical protein